MSELRFDRNRSDAADVSGHLQACAAQFSPPLNARVSIPDYARKLAARAERFEAWAGADLVGLVAAYCDAAMRDEAFVTNVSVLPGWTRRGLARGLMREAAARAGSLGFARLALEVDRAAPALGLYRGLGFTIAGGDGPVLRLSLDLREDGGR